jgi:hypothetical protein
MEVKIERSDWLNPRDAQVPLALWAEEFLSLARRLSPTTQETYRRDLTKYILPRFGADRLGRLPADEIENWLNDEVAAGLTPSSVHRHYRVLRRMMQVAVQKRKLVQLLAAPLLEGAQRCRRLVPAPWPPAHERGLGHRRGRAPEGDPDPDGPLVDQCDARPLRPPVS